MKSTVADPYSTIQFNGDSTPDPAPHQNGPHGLQNGVVDCHHFEVDPDPSLHFDADPDPDSSYRNLPTFYVCWKIIIFKNFNV
jgi:hypothetical protein